METKTQQAVKELARANRSQRDLAGRLGVSAQYVSNLATGSARLTVGFVGRVYVVFGPEAARPFRLAALQSGIVGNMLFEVGNA